MAVRSRNGFDPAVVREVRVATFQVAYDIIGGGEEGDKRRIRTKEEADHSLPYMISVALLDGEVMPDQYAPERIAADDVQRLLRRVVVRPDETYGERFPAEIPSRVEVEYTDGTVHAVETSSYRGFHTDPLEWADALGKFHRITSRFADEELRDRIATVVAHLEQYPVTELTGLLAEIRPAQPDPTQPEKE